MKKCTLVRRRRDRCKETKQFTVDVRNAEITVELVLQARANISDNKVNGPDDDIVSEMIKNLSSKKSHYLEVFSRTLRGHCVDSADVEAVFILFFLHLEMDDDEHTSKTLEMAGAVETHVE